MENEKNSGLPDDWFEDLLTAPDTGEEIGTDEQAVSSHAMTGLSDLELEKIMQEAMSDDWDIPLTEAEPEPQPEPVQDREYADNLEEDPEDEPQALPEGGVPRKVRPRHKGGYGLFGLPHLLSTAIWAAIILVIGVSLGRLDRKSVV